MPDFPDAFLSHKISGRSRLKIPSRKGDLHYFETLKDQLSKCGDIEKIDVNPVSGSVVVYTPDIEKIAEYARNRKIFDLKNNGHNKSDLHSSVSNAFKAVNGKIRSLTGGDMDLADTVFLALLGLGIYQISRGNFTAPAWYTAFWYAFNIFLKSKNKGME